MFSLNIFFFHYFCLCLWAFEQYKWFIKLKNMQYLSHDSVDGRTFTEMDKWWMSKCVNVGNFPKCCQIFNRDLVVINFNAMHLRIHRWGWYFNSWKGNSFWCSFFGNKKKKQHLFTFSSTSIHILVNQVSTTKNSAVCYWSNEKYFVYLKALLGKKNFFFGISVKK